MKKFLLIIILISLPEFVLAETTFPRPHWSLEVKGGNFIPDIEDWSTYYGRRYSGQYGGSLAYKVIKQLEVGIEGMYSRDSGKGFAPLHDEPAGNVKYAVAPLNLFLLARGVFSENQWLIPYAGGGWTRMYYKEEIEFQGVARGYTDGYHARAGLQFSLDVLDPTAANSLYLDFGVHHTYFFVEAEYTRAMIDTVDSAATPARSINLGGTSWLGGLLFEF